MPFEVFPYTNFHELNLDAIIQYVTEIKAKTDSIDDSIELAQEYANNALISEQNASTSATDAEQASQNAISTYAQIQEYTSDLSRQVNNNTQNIAVNSSRIDSFTALGSGSTTGDAELIDGRIGYDGFTYSNIGDAIRKQVIALHNDLSHFTKNTSNLLNMDEITVNKYVGIDGSIVNSNNFSYTEMLPVTPGDTLYFWSKRTDNMYYYFDARFLCAYDGTKNPVSSAGGSFVGGNGTWTAPSNVYYVRLSIANTYLSSWSNFYVGTHAMVDGVTYNEPYGKIIDPDSLEPTIVLDGNGSLLEAVKLCYKLNVKNLHVKTGVYDIIAEYQHEYGSGYFANYTDYATNDPFDRGLWLENINVKFDPFARVVCNYTGTNQNVTDYFSAFACGNNVVIDGLNLSASNLRYGIHPDFNSGSETTYMKIKNCILLHSRANDHTNKTIGAGLGIHVNWEFENIIFRTAYAGYVLRIHNNVNSEAYSKVTIKNCYIENGGFILLNSYSNSTWKSPVLVNNCSFDTPVQEGLETPGSEDNIQLYSFCNELRS